VLGLCDGETRLRDFKFERILSVTLLSEDYQIPGDFSPQNHFKDSWGIWGKKVEVLEPVLLRQVVAEEVKEMGAVYGA
jgi:predicted DNA-binding transcriptional regulator YafY